MNNLFNAPKPGFKLTLFATALALVVVLLGAFTRLKDAGLGCPDWPGCYGFFIMPETQADINIADERYPEMPYEKEKAWPEVVHRIFAGSLGLIIVSIFILAFRHRRSPDQPLKLPAFLIGLVTLQALFGMWTVTLKLWPQVVTTHLLGGFATLSLLWLLCLRLSNTPWTFSLDSASRFRALKPHALLGIVIVILQIALGGWLSANYAAWACPDLPTCNQQWWPEMDFAGGFNLLQSLGPNYLGGQLDNNSRVAIHMAHRIGAIVTLCYLLWLAFKLLKFRFDQPIRNLGKVLIAVLIVQFLLGVSNIVWVLPLPVAVAHNGVGSLLLLVMVTINYRLFTVRA